MRDNLVDVKTMSKMIGVHPNTLYTMVRNGTIRSYRTGSGQRKNLRFDPSEVREDIREDKYKRKHNQR